MHLQSQFLAPLQAQVIANIGPTSQNLLSQPPKTWAWPTQILGKFRFFPKIPIIWILVYFSLWSSGVVALLNVFGLKTTKTPIFDHFPTFDCTLVTQAKMTPKSSF